MCTNLFLCVRSTVAEKYLQHWTPKAPHISCCEGTGIELIWCPGGHQDILHTEQGHAWTYSCDSVPPHDWNSIWHCVSVCTQRGMRSGYRKCVWLQDADVDTCCIGACTYFAHHAFKAHIPHNTQTILPACMVVAQPYETKYWHRCFDMYMWYQENYVISKSSDGNRFPKGRHIFAQRL